MCATLEAVSRLVVASVLALLSSVRCRRVWIIFGAEPELSTVLKRTRDTLTQLPATNTHL